MTLVEHALALLRANPHYREEAAEGSAVANTVIGSVMNVTLKAPRELTERAVREALAILESEKVKSDIVEQAIASE